MKVKIQFVLMILCFLIGACEDNKTKNMQLTSRIQSHIQKDSAYLAQLIASYSIVFTNERKNIIQSDDLYVRKDQAKVFYGYMLDQAKIEIIQQKNQKVLSVSLPLPQKISIDRKTVLIETTHQDYQPVNSVGKAIDIDQWINSQLNNVIKKYESKTIEITKRISRQYFSTLARKYGLQLSLTFKE